MSGTTSICLQQQFHNTTGEPLIGGLLYSMQAGTLNPQNAFRTAALTVGSEYPNPVTLDASARVPLMFYADGLIRLILTDKNGIAQFDYDNVPVLGSSSGGGAVDTTDPTRLFSTGFMMLKYGIGSITGYVRGNGRTIGSSTSGATEFADPTAQALFQYFWNNDANLVVTPSRGVSAVADWGANKQIATPDFRGMAIGGLDGMGSTRANRLSAAGWDAVGTAFGGVEAGLIAIGNMPSHAHSLDIPAGQGAHAHPYDRTPGGALNAASGTGFPINFTPGAAAVSTPTGTVGLPAMTGTAQPAGGGAPFNVTQPTRLVTVYFRL